MAAHEDPFHPEQPPGKEQPDMDANRAPRTAAAPGGQQRLEVVTAMDSPHAGQPCSELDAFTATSGPVVASLGATPVERPHRGAPPAPRECARGASIGRYIVEGELGQGGMGKVYAAYDPELDRRVAIKLLHTRNSGQARKRLVREARALARLSHPCVVQVHDAGVHEGDVFVAMELVEGTSLNRWCRREPRPGWREVLAVYLDAARGVAAAHQKGLVHRDIKPANILVGNDGRVKVADFGLVAAQERSLCSDSSQDVLAEPEHPNPQAEHDSLDSPSLESERRTAPSSLEGSLDERLTRTGTLMGTPAFMAPEQHTGAPVGAAADQYSLCASLYEGLYGQLPFAPTERKRALGEILERKLRGEVTPPPENSDVPAWLHAVLLRGLQPRPDARYPSVLELIAALEDDPLVRRRAHLRVAAVVGMTAALAGLALLGWMRQSESGSPCAGSARALEGIWDDPMRARVTETLLATGVSYAPATAKRMVAVLDDYAATWVSLRTQACEASRTSAGTEQDLSTLQTYCLARRRSQLRALTELFAQGLDAKLVAKAVQAAQSLSPLDYCQDEKALTAVVPPPEDPVVRARVEELEQSVDRLEALFQTGEYGKAQELGQTLLDQMSDLEYPPLRARSMYWIGLAQARLGEHTGARVMIEGVIQQAARARLHVLEAQAWSTLLSTVGTLEGRYEDAMALVPAATAAVERADDDLTRAKWLNDYGALLWRKGKNEQALASHEQALAIRQRALGSEHPEVASSYNNLGLVLEAVGKYEQALASHEKALVIRQAALGPEHPDVALSYNNLGNVLWSLGRHAEALVRHQQALAIKQVALGPETPDVARSLDNIGVVLLDLNRHAEALAHHEEALTIRQAVLGPDHADVGDSFNNLGFLLDIMGRYQEALASHERALAIWQKALGPDHARVATALDNLGIVLRRLGKYEESATYHDKSLAFWRRTMGPEYPAVVASLTGLGRTLVQMRQLDRATAALEQALAIGEKILGKTHAGLTETLLGLGELSLARGRPALAVRPLERAVAMNNPIYQPDVELALAKALWASESSRARARALATQARDHYQRIGHEPGLARASAWLATRR